MEREFEINHAAAAKRRRSPCWLDARRSVPGSLHSHGASQNRVAMSVPLKSPVDDERDRSLCLHQIIENWVSLVPDAIAVEFDGNTLSYRGLNERADRLTRRLQQHGVRKGTLVGICMKRSFEMIVGLVAILKAGGAYVPLDPRLPQERLMFLLADAAIPIILTNGTTLNAGPVRVIDLAGDPGDTETDTEAGSSLTAVTNEDLVYVMYTSGSTGVPKGVMVPHRGVVNWLVWMRRVFDVTPGDVVLKKAPLTFDVSAWELFLPLVSGGRLVLADSDRQYDQRYLAELMASSGVTIAQFVPSLMRAFLEQKSLPNLGTLRHVMCGGEILAPKLASLFQERLTAELCNSYGPTEASIGVTRWVCGRNEQRKSVPIGYPIDNTELYILDADLKPVAHGVSGELYIAGVCLAHGYLNRPELTAERFLPNPFSANMNERMYRTGDLCRFLEDGSIDFLGRMDDQVKVRGVRIELAEVEKALTSHEAVAAAAATALQDSGDNTVLAAYVVPAQGSALTERILRGFLRQRLPLSMIPSVFYFVSSLPVSANGKLDRKALAAPKNAPIPLEPRGEDTEQRIRAIWAELLERDDFRSGDDFFDCGGDSFSAMQLYLRLEEVFDLDTRLDVIDPLTIRNLATKLQDASFHAGDTFPRHSPSSTDSLKSHWIGDVLCRPASLDDVEGVWRVCVRAFPAYAHCSLEEFEALCRHRWLDNPCRTEEDPFGWVLEANRNQIVGFHGLVPTRVWVGGRSVPAVAPTTWAADPGCGGGLALLTTYLDWGSRRFLLNTTANAITSSMHAHSNRGMQRLPIEDFDQRLLWVVDCKSALKWKLSQHNGSGVFRTTVGSGLALSVLGRIAPFAMAPLGGIKPALCAAFGRSRIRFACKKLAVSRVERFGSEFDELWHRLKWNFGVATERTADVLNWRHIAPPRLLGRSYALACREEGRLLGYIALREPATTVPGHFVVTDLFYDPSRPDVMQNLLNAAFEEATARSATVFEIFGFHPRFNRQMRSQCPYVLRRTQLERLGRDNSLMSLLGVLFGADPGSSSTYWYRAPSPELEQACVAGSWWPSGIDGDLNL